jgi:hypothetical protein
MAGLTVGCGILELARYLLGVIALKSVLYWIATSEM